VRLSLAAACLLGLVAAVPGLGTSAHAEPATARVSYLAGGSVYVEAGRLEGLAEGDTLQAVSGGRTVARLVVRFLSTHRAVCDTLQASAMPAVGDAVRFQARPATARAAAPVPAVDSAAVPLEPPASPAAAVTARRTGGLRGRLGARYLIVSPSGAPGYSQPALDVRLDGVNAGGAPIDLAVDVRSRRTFHDASGVVDHGEARVYRMAATLHDGVGRRRVTLGRQLTAALAPVSLFDGALVEYAGERWGVGLFSGAQPDPVSWGVSGDVLQHGGFVMRKGRQGARRWSVTTGGIASFDRGQVDRQFGFVLGSYLDPRVSLYLAEEVDLNTSWKRATGEPLVSLTSTFASARAQVTRGVSFNAGYDNRRNVRLYRDRLTPEIEFDDRHRQGAWVGSAVDVARYLRFAADARWSGGGAGGEYRSWSASTEAYRLPVLQAGVRWRSTRFSGAVARGWLHAVGLAARPSGATRIELSGGARTTTDAFSLLESRARWEELDLDLGLGRGWYLLLSGQRDHGDGSGTTQGQASLSVMF
jgi:hypothetical protein